MLEQDLRSLFDRFVAEAGDYLKAPGVMKALELDQLCMRLYPRLAREADALELSNLVRDFGRGLPRLSQVQLQALYERILDADRHQEK